MLMTCDPHLVKQVLSRGQEFHAPVEVLSLYNLYGPTLASSEGEQWRLYRKITTPFFNTKTYQMVWKESLDKADRLSVQWSSRETYITDVKGEVMSKLNLRVIAKVFYNEELQYNQSDATKDVAPPGHLLTFSESINAVLSNLSTIFGLPKWLLGLRTDCVVQIWTVLTRLLAKSPFKSHQHAYLGFLEWRQYMHEMRDSVRLRLEKAEHKEETCFLGEFTDKSTAFVAPRGNQSWKNNRSKILLMISQNLW
jgi:hypothetical protein